MKLHVEWGRPVVMKDAAHEKLIYSLDLARLPEAYGIYVLGRQWGAEFEAL